MTDQDYVPRSEETVAERIARIIAEAHAEIDRAAARKAAERLKKGHRAQ